MTGRCQHATSEDSAALAGNCPACLLEIGLRSAGDEELSQWITAVLDEDSSDSRAAVPGAQSLTPGTLVSRRFRITGIIGRGGMGEVYRADDLKLGQTVALKFLPQGPEVSAAMEALLYDEVRIGRQVAHPNVCRIYDLLEVEGQHAVVMELVDGENLASLIHRVGRLPYAKALNIARDICAGVEAAHEKGIVHGDLKPANVMIDGVGRARIMDFGLSRAADEGRQRVHAGTIAYMAPEQLRLGNSTRRTDMYALGVVLYEIFTGHRLHDGLDRTQNVPRPSVDQPLLDAALEDAVLRCLSSNPDERPESAKSLLEVMPGGDVLDIALAAGEVPTSDVVASSTKLRELSVTDAWLLLIFALAALWAVVALSDRLTLYGRAGLRTSPGILSDRARTLAGTLSGFEGARDQGYRFEANLDEATIAFHFRADAARLLPLTPEGRVNIEPATAGGSTVDVALDPNGRLLKLRNGTAGKNPLAAWPGWSGVLSEAAVERASLVPVVSEWAPLVRHDRKQEWRAGLTKIRAAAWRSSIVWFDIVPADADSAAGLLNGSKVPHLIYLWLLIASLAAGAYLARRNIRARRIDGRAALRIAAWTFGCRALYGILIAHHSLTLENETALLGLIAGGSILLAAQVWLAYAALEPYVRKFWPETLVGWARMVQGRLRDPLIGRDLLAGASLGLLYRLIDHVRNAIPLVSDLHVTPSHLAVDALASAQEGIGTIFYSQSRAIFYGLFALFILVLLRTFLRSGLAAGAVWLVAMTAIWSRWDDPRVAIPTTAAQMGVLLLGLHRAGLLAVTTALFVQLVTAYIPLTSDPSAFWFPQSTIAVGVVASVVLSGFYWSFAGRPLLASIRGRAVAAPA